MVVLVVMGVPRVCLRALASTWYNLYRGYVDHL